MYYNGFLRRGGCATCGVGNSTNYRNAHSPSFYNNRNFNEYQNEDEGPNNLSLYNSRLQKILTPPRNVSNYNNRFNMENDYSNINRNNFQNYYSPARNTGCRNCSISSSKAITGTDYRSPFNGNYLNRTNNLYTLKNKMNYRNNDEDYKFRKNYYINNKLQSNDDDDDNNYNFRKRYNNNNDDDSFENILNNSRYRSPQRHLVNSFSTSNINNYSNINNFTRYNNYINNDNDNDNDNDNNNKYNQMLSNKYRNFLNNNVDKYNYNNNNYNSPQRRNYYSPSFKNQSNSNNNNNYYLNSRYKYLLPKENNYSNDFRFLTLSIYNYQRELRDILQDKKSFFLCIYGNHDYTGKSWCSDCNIAMPIIEEAKNIIKDKKYEKEIYFINIPIDKINMDYLRDDPVIQLERVPTLIYFENGSEKNRLIENDLFSLQIVKNFILQAYEQYNPRGNQYLYQPKNYY